MSLVEDFFPKPSSSLVEDPTTPHPLIFRGKFSWLFPPASSAAHSPHLYSKAWRLQLCDLDNWSKTRFDQLRRHLGAYKWSPEGTHYLLIYVSSKFLVDKLQTLQALKSFDLTVTVRAFYHSLIFDLLEVEADTNPHRYRHRNPIPPEEDAIVHLSSRHDPAAHFWTYWKPQWVADYPASLDWSKSCCEEKKLEDPAPSKAPAPSKDPGLPPPSAPLLEDDEEKDSTNCCRVCMDKPKRMVILPCRHLALCRTCTNAVKICPICRGPKESTLEVFI